MPGRVRLLVGFVASALPAAAVAQLPAAADSAQFIITRADVRAGSELFRVQRVRTEAGIRLQASIRHREGRRMVDVTLITDTLGSPVQYDGVSRDSGAAVADTVHWIRLDNRLEMRAWSPPGIMPRRSLIVPPGVALLDDSLYAELLFLTLQGGESRSVPAIAPSSGDQRALTLRSLGASDPVNIAGTLVPAVRYSVGDTDGDRREIWLTPRGQLLRIEIRATRTVVLRERPPR